MTPIETLLAIVLFTFYLFCVFTVCFLTFRKGYVLLGIIGIFLPFLWLIGAILPPKPGSSYAVQLGIKEQQAVDQMTR